MLEPMRPTPTNPIFSAIIQFTLMVLVNHKSALFASWRSGWNGATLHDFRAGEHVFFCSGTVSNSGMGAPGRRAAPGEPGSAVTGCLPLANQFYHPSLAHCRTLQISEIQSCRFFGGG
jgi:hypothetical protein